MRIHVVTTILTDTRLDIISLIRNNSTTLGRLTTSQDEREKGEEHHVEHR